MAEWRMRSLPAARASSAPTWPPPRWGGGPAVPAPPQGWRWGYATARAVGEILAHLYARDRGLPGVAVRLFNTIGPRQAAGPGMVVPRFIGQALRGEPLTVYG